MVYLAVFSLFFKSRMLDDTCDGIERCFQHAEKVTDLHLTEITFHQEFLNPIKQAHHNSFSDFLTVDDFFE